MSRSLREEVLKGSPPKMKHKSYGGLNGSTEEGSPSTNTSSHKSNRSISEFHPGVLHNERPRNVTVGTIDGQDDLMQVDSALTREKYLAEQRRLGQPALPTPPPSTRSVTESEADEVREERDFVQYLTIREGLSNRKRKYRPVRPLGQGTFSKVVLATSEKLPPSTKLDETPESNLNPRNLVAIKIVQHGPAGGADAERIDLGLKREVAILRSLSHPTLIHIKAFDWNDHDALIVLNYCAGGDLFDLASQRRELLTAPVVQRMFGELVDATRYLHSLWIVHRDIKLENVLLNIPANALAEIKDPFTYPYPLITLTDLGLSRKIPQPPESPLLQTRCGSEDYAAPEILLGQPYDGRKTDAWALGVLLYALMEGRLPFDPPPIRPGQRPVRSKPTHRIARCDWMWCDYGNEDGEWDPKAGEGWKDARECVEALLKKVTRGRASLDELAEKFYVKDAIACEEELRRPPHADDEEDE
jgi:protein-serine/threonine kinase